ncbi:ATP-grasp domain-containing protein [Hymenobacter sp. 15J16-1T3B]|uniref:ATP-grasp domain-containing protein n=1 Tax=Hymenobacter sp. 15J16-1T3B TaxID=2886941 RepID=UPI001D11D841|nr:ATP-grasp domain-containing protein [Hymenobacter sp. 15J16-1T3B]MCC3160708.1 ATP-grasp domain-containing protein [Hymenobacter sp. 15J16-1T3B]
MSPAADHRPRYVIGVTGLNAIDSPGPGVAVIRALRESPDFTVRIIGLSYEALEPGIYMHDVVDKTYQLPYPSAGTQVLLERLGEIHEREGLDVIIPNFDAELPNFVRLAPRLAALGIRTFLPTLEQLEARDKLNLRAFGEAHGLLVPQQHLLHRADELAQAAEQLGYPLVVKGKFYDATVAHTLEQARKAFHQISAKWGLPVIAQEFVQGHEINVAALGDGTGRTLSAVPMRKLYITDKGKAWAGITLEDETLLQLARRFVERTGWRGGCELELMRAADGRLFVLEINPRFPAWIYLTVAAGQNQPAALVRLALGLPVYPWTEYAVGRMFIRYAWDLITDNHEFHQISAFGEL